MELPFAGMDPYLEAPTRWPDVHHRLITAIANQLQAQLSSRYDAIIQPQTVTEIFEEPLRFVPDVGVFESSKSGQQGRSAVLSAPLTNTVLMEYPTRYARIEIQNLERNKLVTVIEVLSPANKRPGNKGADAYNEKRQELFSTSAHLLELDLLRAGLRPMFARPLPNNPYFIFLSRAKLRPQIEVWPLSLREEIAPVPVPLLTPDPDIVLDVGAALKEIYRQAAYERRIDYKESPPLPELPAEDAVWLDEHLKAKGLR
jgi:Protein of unknown function (DUF4058)